MTTMLSKIKSKLLHFSQFIYLTLSNFNSNNLWESASSCSFGFVFSFIPITLIIMTIFTGIIRVSPEIINYIVSHTEKYITIVDIDLILNNIIKMQRIHFFDVVLTLWIIWMARKFFSSIISALNRIFRSASNRKTLLNQFTTFLSEFVLVIVTVTILLSSFTMNKILRYSFFESARNAYPHLFSQISNNIFSSVVYFMLFIFALYSYKFGSGTRPRWRICFFYALINTFASFVLSFILNNFLNFSNYNVIYGTISAIIILMFKVYFFFVIFLFTAQMIYVSQFFKNLLLAEVYMLPSYDEKKFFRVLKRILFINPLTLEDSKNTKIYQAGEVICTENTKPDCIYYVCSGFVILIIGDKYTKLINQGNFLCDTQCLLNQNTDFIAQAQTQCKILKISKTHFTNMIHSSPNAARKALQTLYGNHPL